jgi:hypothetical protein
MAWTYGSGESRKLDDVRVVGAVLRLGAQRNATSTDIAPRYNYPKFRI